MFGTRGQWVQPSDTNILISVRREAVYTYCLQNTGHFYFAKLTLNGMFVEN